MGEEDPNLTEDERDLVRLAAAYGFDLHRPGEKYAEDPAVAKGLLVDHYRKAKAGEGLPLRVGGRDGARSGGATDTLPQPASEALRSEASTMLTVQPITLREARAFVTRVHRHHKAPQGGLFAVAASEGGVVRAVVIVGKPVARMLDDGWTAEVTRLASDGARNACSLLYAAAWRAARSMGYRRLVTYILKEEDGTSLRAAGWRLIGGAGGGKWSRAGRPRVDDHPTQRKLRWEAGIEKE